VNNAVHERVYLGTDADCGVAYQLLNMAVVHACKTCHQKALRYTGSLDPSHSNYLTLEQGAELFMNLINPPVPLFKLESFKRFLNFAGAHYDEGENLLIHCNQGESRAPSLALLFLAKRLRTINNDSFGLARKDFESSYPGYTPGKGIATFLTQHWSDLA
jgi:hypothetical protein